MSEPMPTRTVEAVRRRAGSACEAMVPGVCTGAAEHLHHRKLRSQGGGNEPDNTLAVCRSCHEWAHLHPKQAQARGLIVRSVHDPASTRVRYRNGGYVLLSDIDPANY